MTDTPKIDAALITQLFGHYERWIPALHHRLFSDFEAATPGINAPSIEQIISGIDILGNGGSIILSGTIGSGKTITAYTGCLIYMWKLYHERVDGERYTEEQAIRHGRYNPFTAYKPHEILKDAFVDIEQYDRIYEHKNLIFIDDLGREHFTDKGFGIAEWDLFFDYRYENKLPTIATTNMNPEQFVQKYNKRIYDRLRETALWIEFTGDSMRKAKADTKPRRRHN